jgi:hypothetical protein
MHAARAPAEALPRAYDDRYSAFVQYSRCGLHRSAAISHEHRPPASGGPAASLYAGSADKPSYVLPIADSHRPRVGLGRGSGSKRIPYRILVRLRRCIIAANRSIFASRTLCLRHRARSTALWRAFGRNAGDRLDPDDDASTHDMDDADVDQAASADVDQAASADVDQAASADVDQAASADVDQAASASDSITASPSAIVEMTVTISLDGTVSDGARNQISESVKDWAAKFAAKLREVEISQRSSGATKAEYTASTVIRTNDILKRQDGDANSGLVGIFLAISAPTSSGAAGILGTYLNSTWQSILFGATAAIAFITTVLLVLMPKLRSR